MPSSAAIIGGSFTAYIPDDGAQIDLGWDQVRIYWATSETATATLVSTQTLVDGQIDYTYNNETALITDWAEWCLYNSTDAEEGPRSERVPIGPPQSTRKLIRQGAGRRLRLLDGPYTIASVDDSDTCTIDELVDPDAAVGRFANKYIRVVEGTAIGQTRRIRNITNSGYVPATGKLTINRATNPAWVANDVAEVWRPKGDEDPSALIDEAMNRVATRVWWRDTFYFSIDSNVSEYFMPATMRPEAIVAVEWASDSYPDRPGWSPVGGWEWVYEQGNGVMSVRRTNLGDPSYYDQGDILRVTYNRYGDAMDTDSDYWNVNLQWAIAETAMEFLDTIGTPSGSKEEITDAERARAAVARDLEHFRRVFMPAARPQVRLPR